MKLTLFFILSLVIVLLTSYYQRVTGPTYEKIIETTINNIDYSFTLPRSHELKDPCVIQLEIADTSVAAIVHYKRYPTNDDFTLVQFSRKGAFLSVSLPDQPAAGKLAYFIELVTPQGSVFIEKEQPTLIRFKGAVPIYILLTHIFFMFIGMWLSNLTGILEIANHHKQMFFAVLTLIFLVLGGMVFGPIVQKFAFNEYWAGIPFGWDLTDNKTLIAVVAWLIALAANWKQKRRGWYIAAAIITFAIFIIPHSLMGSEFDYQAGEVTTG